MLEPNWILWPPGSDPLVRLLPLTTGVDWALRVDGFPVRESGGGQVLLNTAEFEARGLFAARAGLLAGRRLVPLAREGGALSREAIALCSDGARPVRAATPRDLADPRTILVAVAATGDAIVRVRRAATGRVLLVELPSAEGSLSRFHLLGPGWPAESVPTLRNVPGLIPAREASRLLTRPESFAWTPRAPLLYREADRWAGPARSGWATWVLVLVAVGAGIAGIVELARDRRGLATTLAAWGSLAVPAAVLLSPWAALGFGPELLPLAVIVLVVPLVALAWVASRFWGDRYAVALVAVVGVLATGWAGPLHPWSGVLRDLPNGLSPEVLGAAALYAAAGIAATRDGEGFLWLVVRLANVGAVAGLLFRAPEMAFAVPLGWAAGVGAMPWTALPALGALPYGLARVLRGGIDVRPLDLVREAPVVPVLNLWHVGAFVLSGPTLVLGFAVAFGAMTAVPYAGYRLRRSGWGPGQATLWAAAGIAAACLLAPEWLPSVLVVIAGGLPLFVAEARQAG